MRNFFATLNPFKSEKTDNRSSGLLGAIATRRNAFDVADDKIANPNTDNNKLPNSLQVYSNFTNDPHVWSCVQSRKSGVLSMDWEITHGDSGSPVTELINSVFNWLDIRKIMIQILDAPLYGFQPLEIFWDYDGQFLVPMDLVAKPAWWFYFDNDNMCRFKDYSNGTVLQRNKFIVVQHNGSYYNPYGDAIFAKCYASLIFKRGGIELWALFVQKYGMPWLWAKVGSGKAEDLDAILKAIIELKQTGGISTPEDVDIQVLDEGANSNSSENYLKFIHFCNAEISKAILSQTLTTEQGETGSYAMSQTHLQVRDDVVMSDARLVESAFNQLIKYIVELNFNDVGELPKFELYGELEADITLARRDQIIFSTGYVKPTKEYLMRHHNYKEDEIEMIEPAAQPAFAEGAEAEPLPDAALNTINQAVELIKQGKSYGEIETAITNMLPNINTEELEQYLAESIMIAQAEGIIGGAKK